MNGRGLPSHVGELWTDNLLMMRTGLGIGLDCHGGARALPSRTVALNAFACWTARAAPLVSICAAFTRDGLPPSPTSSRRRHGASGSRK